jgi:lipoprotein-anchoring transpeptidase ErfK/SrfK
MTRRTTLGIATGAAALALFVVAVLVIDATRTQRIADGVRIGTVDVGGLQRGEAENEVRSALASRVAAPVTATHGDERFVLTPQQAGVALLVEESVDEALRRSRDGTNPFTRVLGGHDAAGTIEPRVAVSRPAVERFAAKVADAVDTESRDADIDWVGGRIQKTKARIGVTTKRDALVTTTLARLRSPGAPRAVEVPVADAERPDETLTDLADRYPTVITIDRAGKRLRLYEDLKLARTFDVAVGKEGNETAPGRYKIQSKQVDPVWNVPQSDWAGSLAGQTIPAGDPRNPLVARWMGFNGSQGIHGTDEIDSLGQTASHGCIRMAKEDVEALYDEVRTGTPVFVQ